MNLLQESSFYQMLLEEGEKKGIEKGRHEGREEGLITARETWSAPHFLVHPKWKSIMR